jgi:iron complex transport system substrate-binding protein
MIRIFASLLLVIPLLCAHAARAEVSIVDDAGRAVTLDNPARRIVLTDGMGFLSLALLDPHPETLLAGWNRGRLDADMLRAFRAALPGLDRVPDIGEPGASGASLEQMIALAPDLVVLDPFYNQSAAAIRTMESAGIAVAVLALTPSIRDDEPTAGLGRLGVLLGRQERADAYTAFVRARLERIRKRVAGLGREQRPPVLLEAHASRESCCMATGGGRGIGDFIGLAGGSGIGADVIPGMAGPLSLEYIIGKAPAVYIGTGGGYMAARGGLVVGASVSEEQARDSLQSVLSRKGFGELPAVASGRAYGLSHGLAISGINIVAIEAIAGWIHPELFPDIDPEATLMEIGKRFLPAQLEGTWWVEAASKDWK